MSTIDGTTGNDSLNGTSGSDTVYGGAGNDTINPGAGIDTVYAGDGADVVNAGGDGASDGVHGGAGNDSLYGTGAINGEQDAFWGDAGADLISSGDGSNQVYGGTENDTIYGGGGNDTLSGDGGADVIDSGSGFDTVYGGAGADSLSGGADAGLFDAGTENDTIYFGAGSDTVYGGDGNDLIDDVNGSNLSGVNLIYGGAGDDTAWAGNDNDTLSGGTGNDLLWGEANDDSIQGDAGADTLWGGSGNDALFGGTEADQLYGEAGNDTLRGGAGADTLYGGSETDMLDYSDATAGVSVNLAANTTGGWAAGDVIGAFEGLTGSAYADTLTGDGNANAIYGSDGNDSIAGGAGNDTVDAGAGNDTVQGGSGFDSLIGGAGTDLLDYSNEASGVSVNLATGAVGGAAAGDTISGFENLTGSAFADTLQAGTDNNLIAGAGGDDSIRARAGDDTLYGGDGADTLQGNEGSDRLYGDAGADTLEGGAGNDTLTGGTGADLYRMEVAGGADHVTDFDTTLVNGLTTDRLDVSGLTDAQGVPVKSFDVTVADDGHGNAVLGFPGGETLVLDGISPATVSQPGMLVKMGIPCFAAGTRIAVPGGWRAVEALRPGDLVATPDGPRPVLWTGCRRVEAAELAARPELRPIRLRAGHYGLTRDLVVSAQHGVAVAGRLIRARHLAEWGRGARVAMGISRVSYHHVLLPAHALILAEGAWTESFHPGPEAVRALSPADRAALHLALGAAPGAELVALHGPRCLPLLSGSAARAVLQGGANQPDEERHRHPRPVLPPVPAPGLAATH